jgi:histone-lysine N-methyltransferase SETMAR
VILNIAGLHFDLREEEGAHCKIPWLLGKCSSEIKADLDLVYGKNLHSIVRWVSMFKEGRTNVMDDPRPGWLVSATSEKDISTFKAIVDEDARYTMEEISDKLGLNVSYVFCILKEKLRKVCAHWIPHLLTSNQKRMRIEKASALLTRFKDRNLDTWE